MAETYEVLAVRYGTRSTTKSDVYLNYGVYGEADEPLDMDYYFWVARNAARTVLFDCGFGSASGERRGRTTLIDPLAALAVLGIAPDSLDAVVITHAHYDHIGNLARLGDVDVFISRREFEFWTGPFGGRTQFAHSAEADEIAYLAKLHADGKLRLLDAVTELAPGLELIEIGGHTPGQLVAIVATAAGRTVLASDALHYYEELDRDRPFAMVADLAGMYAGFDRLHELAARPGVTLVAGHDPAVRDRFPAVAEHIVRVG